MGQGGSHSLRNFDGLRACDLQKGRAQRWVVCILQTALLAVAAAVAPVAVYLPTYLPNGGMRSCATAVNGTTARPDGSVRVKALVSDRAEEPSARRARMCACFRR